MNHGFKLHSDGTLEITIPKGVKVSRVLVQEEMSQNGALYYSDGLMEQYKWERDIAISQLKDLGYELGEKPRKSDVPGTNIGNLIDKERLLDDLKEMCIISFWEANEHSEECYQDIYKYIESMSSAQPERKKGKWIKEDITHEIVCSVCNGIRRDDRISHTNFCNCCGSYMGGEQDDID